MRAHALTLALLALSVGCSDDRLTDPLAPPGLALTLAPSTDTLYVDDALATATSVQLVVSATSRGDPVAVPPGRVFASADPGVAVVDSISGVVTAVAPGTSQLSVRVNDVKGYATIVVLNVVRSVQLATVSSQALAGDTIPLTATVLGWQGQPLTGQPIVWTSSNPIATVTPDGKVVFSAAGSATINAASASTSASVDLSALAREFVGGGAGSIASGMDATCGLLPLGKTFCFGLAPLVGVARDTSCFGDATPNAILPCTLVPLQIAGQLQLTAVTVGDSVACGLNAQGRAYCWGDDSYGEIGNGVALVGSSALPARVTGPLSAQATFSTISAGRTHVCALDPVGRAYCWGADSAYQLGNGDTLRVNSSTPIPVQGTTVYSAIAAGRAHSCAIRASDGVAVCWGANGVGQLGRGTFGDSSDVPMPVVGGQRFTQLSTKGDFTCGLTSGATIYCWGYDMTDAGGIHRISGQTGQAADSISASPVAIAGTGYTSVAAGWNHACALTAGGSTECWGDDYYGQLGRNTSDRNSHAAPDTVVTGPVFTAISAGSRSTCAVAADGAYCWGSAVYGATGTQIQALKVLAPRKTAIPQ
jgi:alpha-tubulin suppressor-like RCC1 family protein